MEKIVLIAGLIAFTAFNFIPKKEKSDPGRDAVQLSRSVIPVLDEKPITPIPRVGHAKTTKHVVVKENPIANEFSRQPMLEVTLVTPPIDTVPEKGKKKTGYDQLTFPSISSSTNDDGKKKTQSVTVTDQSGKKYSYKKENDKLTSLIVDGKTIPESEYGNYSPLLDKIEQTMQENRAKRMEQMQLRKVERVMRVQDQRNRIAQSNLIRQYQNAQRQYQNTQRQYERQQEMQYKLMERSRKSSEDQKREMMRLMNRLKQRQMKPMLNGREVIKVDPPVELLKDQNVLIKADINSINQSAMVAQPVNNRMKVALVEPVILKRAERPILQNRSVSVKPTMSTIPLRRKVVI